MATSPSSTSSSRSFWRDLVVAVLVLAAFEFFLARSLAIFEPPADVNVTATTLDATRPDGFHSMAGQDPLAAFAQLNRELDGGPVVFVGDSQGAAPHGGGAAYPQQALDRLRSADPAAAVISLHLGGANAYEQGALLLAMVDAGIRPRLIVWSHSIFSQRKNQIRSELVATYRAVESTLAPIAGSVVLVGDADPADAGSESPGVRRSVAALTGQWDGVIARSASVSFMRRPLYDKGQILRRSELGRLVPTSVLGGTARRFDPPASILLDAAGVVGGVSRILVDGGACVVNVIAPIDRAVTPRAFSPRSEAVSYPALEAASHEAGAGFVNLLDAMPHVNFGEYEDGTRDAFHFDAAGHAALTDSLLTAAGRLCGQPTR